MKLNFLVPTEGVKGNRPQKRLDPPGQDKRGGKREERRKKEKVPWMVEKRFRSRGLNNNLSRKKKRA